MAYPKREGPPRRSVMLSLDEPTTERLDDAVKAEVAQDRSAVVRELAEAWAEDDRVRRAVASWRARAKR